jgi:hypothetical protein
MFRFVFDASKIKRLIYHKSLNWYRTVCPYCGLDNPDIESKRSALYSRENVGLPLDVCPSCRNVYDMENMVVKMSKDYAECKALGLKGAVKKNEKGAWIQA